MGVESAWDMSAAIQNAAAKLKGLGF